LLQAIGCTDCCCILCNTVYGPPAIGSCRLLPELLGFSATDITLDLFRSKRFGRHLPLSQRIKDVKTAVSGNVSNPLSECAASESPSLLTSVSTGGQLLSLPASAQWSVCCLLVMEWSIIVFCVFRAHLVLVLPTFEVRCQLCICWFALLRAFLAARLARLCLLCIIRMQFLVSRSVFVF
jgi:hypothetical protein